MDKRIVYINEDGTIGIIIPADMGEMTIEQLAQKDVPTGLTYHCLLYTSPSPRDVEESRIPSYA